MLTLRVAFIVRGPPESFTNMTFNDQSISRRPFLKGAGVTLAALGGLASPVGAKKGGKTNLTDQAADILVYFSVVGPNIGDGEADNPNNVGEFGFPGTPAGPTGGLFIARNDPAGGLFDFGKIVMTPNGGTLHNSWELFSGNLMASDPKPYVLVHEGGGLYESRGQVMRFEAKDLPEMPAPFRQSPPAQILQGQTWKAVATEQARLGLKANGRPDPAAPEWGVTRIDFYHADTHRYVTSLLYVIIADDTEETPFDGLAKVPEASGVATSLITGGRLNPGGQ